MIEQAFGTTLDMSQVESASPAPKKRKVKSLAKMVIGGAEDTDYSSDEGGMRPVKVKRGTGYSGSAREDVSWNCLTTRLTADVWTGRRREGSERKRQEDSDPALAGGSVPAHTQAREWAAHF
jgi:hypothetical protein